MSKLYVPQQVWETTLGLLKPYAEARVEAGCYWYGLRAASRDGAVVLVGIPRQTARPRNFDVSPDDLAALSETVSTLGLACLAQVHTHPGIDVAHSCWDDSHAVSIKALSVVLPEYGGVPVTWKSIGVHRYEDGRWRRLSEREAMDAVVILGPAVDGR